MDEDSNFIPLAALVANVLAWLSQEKQKGGEDGWHSNNHHANDAEKQPNADREELNQDPAKP